MKRLLDEADPTLGALTALVASAERHQSSPFAKRHVQSRLTRALEAGRAAPRRVLRPAVLALAGLFVAASAAAAGYTLLASSKKPEPLAPVVAAPSPTEERAHAPRAAHVATPALPPPAEPAAVEPPSAKRTDKPRAGEDPSQVAEAVRALRKQGDAARAQALLDQYLRTNPRGALAEDALALSIEAAAARKDPRAADYARRYLSRYPNGRFRGVAERALSR
jgi:hypothetical protein